MLDASKIKTELIDRKKALAYIKTIEPRHVAFQSEYYISSSYDDKIIAVFVFSFSPVLCAKIRKLGLDFLKRGEYLEMKHIFGKPCTLEMAKYSLNAAMNILKDINKGEIRVVYTQTSGLPQDDGTLYRLSGWVYFEEEKCKNWYLTSKGICKNINHAMRFGQHSGSGATPSQVGKRLYGEGRIIETNKYNYVTALDSDFIALLDKNKLPYIELGY